MAKICEECGREFENRSVRCPICKRDLVSIKSGSWEKEGIDWTQERDRQAWREQQELEGQERERRGQEQDRQAWREEYEQEQDGRIRREQTGQRPQGGQTGQRPQGGQTGQRTSIGRTGQVQGVRTWHLPGVEARAAQRMQNRQGRPAGQVQGVQTWHLPAAEARAMQRQQARTGRSSDQEQGVQTWHLPGAETKAMQRRQTGGKPRNARTGRPQGAYAGRAQGAYAERAQDAYAERPQSAYAGRSQDTYTERPQGAYAGRQQDAYTERPQDVQAEQGLQADQLLDEQIRQIEDWEQDLDQDSGWIGDGRAEGESSAVSGEISEFEDWVRKNHLTEEDLRYIKSTARNRAILYCIFAGPLCLNAWMLYKIIKQRTFEPEHGALYTLYAWVTSISFITILPAIVWFIAKKTGYGTGVRGICKNGLAGCGEISALRRKKFKAIQRQSFILRISAAGIISLGDFIYSALTRGIDIGMAFEDFFVLYIIFAIICIFIDNWRYIRACRKEGQKLGSGTGMLEELQKKLAEQQNELVEGILDMLSSSGNREIQDPSTVATLYFHGDGIHSANTLYVHIDGEKKCSFEGGREGRTTVAPGEHYMQFFVYNDAAENYYLNSADTYIFEAGVEYDFRW